MTANPAKPMNVNTVLLAIVVAIGGWNLKTTHDQAVESARDRGNIALQVQGIDNKIQNLTRNRWGTTHMKIFADKMEKDNPTVRVPDPLQIQKDYEP